jgi:large subunit ribosomal protein L23
MARTKTATESTVVEAPVTEVKKTVKKAKAVKVTSPEVPSAVTAKATIKSFDVIIRPLITEKSMQRLEKLNKVTVEVSDKANKTEVKIAFETTFKVKVKQVNILNVREKFTRRGRYPGTISGFKKAVVTLVGGQALDLFKE